MAIIYISGIDGCGKTTQAKLLVKTLKQRGFDAEYKWLRWEPSFQQVFRFFKSLIARSKVKEKTEVVEIENIEHWKWFAFKRKFLSNIVIRQLWWFHACLDYYYKFRKYFRNRNVEISVVDRYVDDFIIDQACNFGLSPEKSYQLADNLFLTNFRVPDLKIIIDLPASEGYARKRDGTPLEYLKEREPYYKSVPASENTVHLNGLCDVASLAEQIEKWVINKLPGVSI